MCGMVEMGWAVCQRPGTVAGWTTSGSTDCWTKVASLVKRNFWRWMVRTIWKQESHGVSWGFVIVVHERGDKRFSWFCCLRRWLSDLVQQEKEDKGLERENFIQKEIVQGWRFKNKKSFFSNGIRFYSLYFYKSLLLATDVYSQCSKSTRWSTGLCG